MYKCKISVRNEIFRYIILDHGATLKTNMVEEAYHVGLYHSKMPGDQGGTQKHFFWKK